ncbi:hypothetical protein MLD38_010775 [Melastoma candidum]|uniref:Uncharacterized protein n=1 Tax=Melastoma candidum TaxID=119954 RepID=A0ACB9R1G9_9MYRT|nr:hypothetical protein MLD38_010775 [Melastoma candidum]
MKGQGGRRDGGNLRNPCLTMHQPWASLLVHGIKRVEGRSWPSPVRGRLWIHAAGKVPDAETIEAMEDFYREIYSVDGVTDLKFPHHYPVSRLLGCVDVVGCVRREELASWEAVTEGVRLEAQTDFCWLCERPQRLVIPFEMRGFQGVYNLEKKIFDAAVRGLSVVESPLPVRFPIPDPRDPFSLKPGSLSLIPVESKPNDMEKSSSLSAAIAGARAAATQFSKKNHGHNNAHVMIAVATETHFPDNTNPTADAEGSPTASSGPSSHPGRSDDNQQQRRTRQQTNGTSKIFAEAIKGLKL